MARKVHPCSNVRQAWSTWSSGVGDLDDRWSAEGDADQLTTSFTIHNNSEIEFASTVTIEANGKGNLVPGAI